MKVDFYGGVWLTHISPDHEEAIYACLLKIKKQTKQQQQHHHLEIENHTSRAVLTEYWWF